MTEKVRKPRTKKVLSEKEQEEKSKRVGKRRKHEYTKEEEKELIAAAQKGDKVALRKLVEVNDRLLNSYVRKRSYETDLSQEDLKQEAIIGLINAIMKYDLSFNVKLITYAYFSINRMLNNAVQDNKQIKISQYGFCRYRLINQVIAEETKKTGLVPTLEEIAQKLNMSVSTVDSILAINNVFSVDNFKNDSDDSDFQTADLNREVNEIPEEKEDNYADLYSVIDSLSEIKKSVLIDYYGLYGSPKLKIEQIRNKYGLQTQQINSLLGEIYNDIKACY